MECKGECLQSYLEWMVSVLIETYWNVKTHWPQGIKKVSSVLIETYWNVKTVTLEELTEEQISINRNILECKARIQQATALQAAY